MANKTRTILLTTIIFNLAEFSMGRNLMRRRKSGKDPQNWEVGLALCSPTNTPSWVLAEIQSVSPIDCCARHISEIDTVE